MAPLCAMTIGTAHPLACKGILASIFSLKSRCRCIGSSIMLALCYDCVICCQENLLSGGIFASSEGKMARFFPSLSESGSKPRSMVFVDGENLAIRYGNMIRQQSKPPPGHVF